MAETARVSQRIGEEIRIYLFDLLKRGLLSGAEHTEGRIKTAAQYRGAALEFIRTKMTDRVARARILKWYDDALANRENDPFMENRVADMLAIMYGVCADDEARLKFFTDLGKSGDLNQALNFTEARRFLVMWLVVKKYGRKTWEWVSGAWESVSDYLESHPTGAKSFLESVLESIRAEIREDRGRYDESAEILEPDSHRAVIRRWMQRQTAATQEAHEERLARGKEEIYLAWRDGAELPHHRVRKNRTTLYVVLLFAVIFGTILIVHWR